MHLSESYGMTIKSILTDGFSITAQLDWLSSDFPEMHISLQMAKVIQLLGEELPKLKPDLLMLVGDRYESAAAALAAVSFMIPVVHLHGGEETEGALDNLFRHAITKLSHLHLVSHPLYKERVIQMGEDPQTVYVVGAPGLDNLYRTDLPDRKALEETLGMSLEAPVVIVTIHPVTSNPIETEAILSALIPIITNTDASYIITLPNSDPGNSTIRSAFLPLGTNCSCVKVVEALGERVYFGLMRLAALMIGNSSSGLIEAGVYQLPVINIGTRQSGRLRSRNVIDVEPDTIMIQNAILKALSEEFRASLVGTTSPYGDGRSGERIVEVLRHWSRPLTTQKSFHILDR
jgi:UDP-hydrolysing UDP-N-acetyl-D-glucosamine 2-epimerase